MSKKYYFAGIRLELPDLEMPEHWAQFEKEMPYLFDMCLTLSEEPLDIDEEEAKSYGRAKVVKKENRWIFPSSTLNIDVEKLKAQAKGNVADFTGENAMKKNPTGGDNQGTDPVQLSEQESALEEVSGQSERPEQSEALEQSEQSQQDGPWGISASADYTDCVLHSEGYSKKTVGTLHTAVDAALPLHGGSIIHASCVIYKGKAILFCGPSGMGKSTQARLWQERFGTYMISSDAPAVYPTADGAVAYGMPWDGSDQIITQESAPVAAVIELAQAKENRIRRMSESQAYNRLLQQGHLPLWDNEAMLYEMQVLKKIASAVPFYHLDCLPNAEAAELVEQTLFSKDSNFR